MVLPLQIMCVFCETVSTKLHLNLFSIMPLWNFELVTDSTESDCFHYL